VGNRAVLVAVLAFSSLVTACAPHGAGTPALPPATRIVGYYFGPTANRGFTPDHIKGNQLTHINYAFGQVLENGTAALANPALDKTNFEALRLLKQRYPHLQILIAFGGWGGSKYFSNAAVTQASRAHFIETMIDEFFRPFPGLFDGVDIDWEYPVRGGTEGMIHRPEDRDNLTALIRELRATLDTLQPRKRYLITAALPAGISQLVKFDMAQLGQLLDFVNVMSYDYYTAGSKVAAFNSPLASSSGDPNPQYNITASAAAFYSAGIPRDKMVIGVPFYGYGYARVPAADNGRFQAVDRSVPLDSVEGKWARTLRYFSIKDVRNDGFQRFWDDVAQVPWLYNAKTQTFVTYDDPQSMRAKADFVRTQRLGGIMIWELSGDDGSLLKSIVKGLH
jgi:chitinase